MIRLISVQPAGDGWSVAVDDVDGDMMFLSGAKAEAAARRVANALARSGQEAEIRIFLRDGRMGGRFAVPARRLALVG